MANGNNPSQGGVLSSKMLSHIVVSPVRFQRDVMFTCCPVSLVLVNFKFPSGQELILHECAPQFAIQLFEQWLGDVYTIHTFNTSTFDDTCEHRPLMLSPHLLGWPEHRPRLYTVMTLNARCYLESLGLGMIVNLLRSPTISVSSLFCAPKEILPVKGA